MEDYEKNKLCEFLGGSHLYGTNTPESDEDLRGVYATSNLSDIFGLNKGSKANVSVTDEKDHVYYEIAHFMNLLQKTNPNILEFLYVPQEKFKLTHPVYQKILDNREYLINSSNIRNSFYGYMQGETRLVLGERVGRLGGKRKSSLDKYGYSPKNMCNLLRLFHTGKHFFHTGEFKTHIKDEPYFDECMDVKVNPQNYTYDQIAKKCASLIEDFRSVKDELNYEFSQEKAVGIMMDAYGLKKI